MPEPWYERVNPDTNLLQGDFVLDCPLLEWKHEKLTAEGENETELLSGSIDAVKLDVVIMTQACDLEQHKVDEVVVCPIWPLTQFKSEWETRERSRNQNPTPASWKRLCVGIRDGYQWNYAMLNSGDVGGLRTEHRVVDFHDIYTLPLEFLSGIAARRGPRLRLRPPYREHLSQSFARYFMRVGLPSSVEVVW